MGGLMFSCLGRVDTPRAGRGFLVQRPDLTTHLRIKILI